VQLVRQAVLVGVRVVVAVVAVQAGQGFLAVAVDLVVELERWAVMVLLLVAVAAVPAQRALRVVLDYLAQAVRLQAQAAVGVREY
jgi:hypothetical protein